MTAYILQRLIQSILVLLAVSIVVFLAVYGIGDPIELLVPPKVSAAERMAMIQRLGPGFGIHIAFDEAFLEARIQSITDTLLNGIRVKR